MLCRCACTRESSRGEAAPVNNAGVIEFVANHVVAGADEGTDDANIGHVACIEH